MSEDEKWLQNQYNSSLEDFATWNDYLTFLVTFRAMIQFSRPQTLNDK